MQVLLDSKQKVNQLEQDKIMFKNNLECKFYNSNDYKLIEKICDLIETENDYYFINDIFNSNYDKSLAFLYNEILKHHGYDPIPENPEKKDRDNTKNIIRSLREAAGLTQKELGERLGLQTSAVSKYEKGRVQNIKKDTIQDMANLFDVSPAYLMGWEKDNRGLPIIGVVRAGFGGIAQEDIIGYHRPPRDGYSESEYFYLKVKGNSMYPDIKEGSLALVKMQSDVDNGQLAIVLINGDEGVIKQIFKSDNSITLHSFNVYYPDRTFEGKEMQNIRILGRVMETTAAW